MMTEGMGRKIFEKDIKNDLKDQALEYGEREKAFLEDFLEEVKKILGKEKAEKLQFSITEKGEGATLVINGPLYESEVVEIMHYPKELQDEQGSHFQGYTFETGGKRFVVEWQGEQNAGDELWKAVQKALELKTTKVN
ncbi:MAG: hypothetical protein KBD29_00430 [Candidatus Magasanikbacteria bacterium]|nr:hypothetical protein [Candidatus Magasanikbacteria bacterium]